MGLFKNPFGAKRPKERRPDDKQVLLGGPSPAAPLPVRLVPIPPPPPLSGVRPKKRGGPGHWPKGKPRPESHKQATREGMERARAAGKPIGRQRKVV